MLRFDYMHKCVSVVQKSGDEGQDGDPAGERECFAIWLIPCTLRDSSNKTKRIQDKLTKPPYHF